MNATLFINYRREDTAPYAGRLYDRLTAHFGEGQVFMDIDQIEPGEDFVEVINSKVGACDIAIVAIGRDWLHATDASGKRRLDDEEDFVRMEIVAALQRKIRVIPVLVGGAQMPGKHDLPEALAPLSRRNAIELSETRFHADVNRLIEAIERAFAVVQKEAEPSATPTAPPPAPATVIPPEPKKIDAEAISAAAPVSFDETRPHFPTRATPPHREQVTEPIYQEPQEPNMDVSSDASTAPQAKIKSRVSNRRKEPGWLLALIFNRDLLIFATKWTLACLLGEAIGLRVVLSVSESTPMYSWYSMVFGLLFGVSIGVAVGSTQWVLLRRRIDYPQWWILLTTIGWVMGSVTAFLTMPEPFLGIGYAPVAVGTMQWLVLRRSVSRAAWWILIVSIAGALGFYAGQLLWVRLYDLIGSIWALTFQGAIAGAISGVITGFGLGILLQRAGKGLGPLKQESSAQR